MCVLDNNPSKNLYDSVDGNESDDDPFPYKFSNDTKPAYMDTSRGTYQAAEVPSSIHDTRISTGYTASNKSNKLCSACHLSKPRSDFSGTQWENGHTARCKMCVLDNNPSKNLYDSVDDNEIDENPFPYKFSNDTKPAYMDMSRDTILTPEQTIPIIPISSSMPCDNHDLISNKKCSKCNLTKPADSFSNRQYRNSIGRCKECVLHAISTLTSRPANESPPIVEEQMMYCTSCGLWKAITDFSKARRDTDEKCCIKCFADKDEYQMNIDMKESHSKSFVKKSIDLPKIEAPQSRLLLDLVSDGDIEILVDHLQGGGYTQTDLTKSLKNVKECISSLQIDEMGAGDDQDLLDEIRYELKDYDCKQKLIKIYINLLNILSLLRILKNMETYAFIPLKATNIELNEAGNSDGSAEFLFCSIFTDGMKQNRHTSLIPLSRNPVWSLESYEYKISGHMTTTEHQFEKSVKIDLMKGLLIGPTIKLGSWSSKMQDVSHCMDSQGNAEITHELENVEYLCPGSTMTVKFRKIALDPEYYKKKRDETDRALRNLAEWIVSFQEETNKMWQLESPLIDGNINILGTSALHAAAFLGDVELVKRFLELGGDPFTKSSEYGSVMDLAAELADQSRKKGDQYSEKCYSSICQKLQLPADISHGDAIL
jgi:hypothetical protein